MKTFKEIREGTFMITVRKAGPGGKDLNVKVKGRDKNDAVKQWRMKNKKYKNDEVEVSESNNLQELSPETLDRYMAKSDASIRDLKKKARAHKTLGNKDDEKRLRQKMKKREKGFTGAVIRHRAKALGGIKLDPKSPVAKALLSMPKNLLKKYGLELAHVENDNTMIVIESDANWAKSLEKIQKQRQLDKISDKDKETLMKIAALLGKEKKRR